MIKTQHWLIAFMTLVFVGSSGFLPKLAHAGSIKGPLYNINVNPATGEAKFLFHTDDVVYVTPDLGACIINGSNPVGANSVNPGNFYIFRLDVSLHSKATVANAMAAAALGNYVEVSAVVDNPMCRVVDLSSGYKR